MTHFRHVSPGLSPTALCGRSVGPKDPDDGHRGYDYCSLPADGIFDVEWCTACLRELEEEARARASARVCLEEP